MGIASRAVSAPSANLGAFMACELYSLTCHLFYSKLSDYAGAWHSQVSSSNVQRLARCLRPKCEPYRVYGLRGLLANLQLILFKIKPLCWGFAQSSFCAQEHSSRALSAPKGVVFFIHLLCVLWVRGSGREARARAAVNCEEAGVVSFTHLLCVLCLRRVCVL